MYQVLVALKSTHRKRPRFPPSLIVMCSQKHAIIYIYIYSAIEIN